MTFSWDQVTFEFNSLFAVFLFVTYTNQLIFKQILVFILFQLFLLNGAIERRLLTVNNINNEATVNPIIIPSQKP